MTNGRIKATLSADWQWVLLVNNGLGTKGGYDKTVKFLEIHRHLMSSILTGNGFSTLGIEKHRFPKFKAYAESQGIEIV